MHPCCNGSLQTGTKIIAIVQLICAIFICIFGIISLSFGGILAAFGFADDGSINSETTPATTGIDSMSDKDKAALVGAALMIVSVVIILVGALSVLFAVLLLVGANKRNRTLCMIWFVLEVISVVMMSIQLISAIFGNATAGGILVDLLGVGLTSYFLWVVWAFMEELKQEAGASPYAHSKPRV